MQRLDKIVEIWPLVNDWRIAPTDFSFCNMGTALRVGHGSTIGIGARLKNRVCIGDHVRIDNHVRIDHGAVIAADAHLMNDVIIEDDVYIGEFSFIGAHTCIYENSHIGDGARIGSNARNVTDIGFADGFRKCIAEVDGVAYIGAGCRWFTLSKALQHWGKPLSQ